jgi:hypothetical protein
MLKPLIPLAALILAAPVQAQSVGDLTVVTEGLIAAGIAYEIGDKCDSIDARLIRGIAFLNGLRDAASDAGFSDAEIDAYIDDDAEKDRLEAIARERLAAMGAVPGDAESYCAVGAAEMAAGSQIGLLLR